MTCSTTHISSISAVFFPQSIHQMEMNRRRLRELLEEQQEPFLISKSPFRNAGSGRTLCCPSRILDWIAHGKMLHWPSVGGRLRAFSFCWKMGREALVMKFEHLSCSGFSSRGASDHWINTEKEAAPRSPVSVLELHSNESSIFHSNSEENPSNYSNSNTSSEGASEFEGLLASPCSPLQEKREWYKRKKLVLQCVEELEIIKLIGMDYLGSKREWSNFHEEMEEVGREIEGAIFEAMREEAMWDMLISHSMYGSCWL